mgnify:CR=1 FL=1
MSVPVVRYHAQMKDLDAEVSWVRHRMASLEKEYGVLALSLFDSHPEETMKWTEISALSRRLDNLLLHRNQLANSWYEAEEIWDHAQDEFDNSPQGLASMTVRNARLEERVRVLTRTNTELFRENEFLVVMNDSYQARFDCSARVAFSRSGSSVFPPIDP